MLKKLFKVGILSTLFISASAQAEEKLSGWNIDVHGNKVFHVIDNDDLFEASNTKLDNAYGFGASVNYLLDNNLEFGVDAGYRLNKQTSKVHADQKYQNTMYTVMAKANYYVDLGSNIMPFVGVAVGGAKVDLDREANGIVAPVALVKVESAINKVKLAGSAEAGLVAVASQNMMLGVSAQYFTTVNLDKDDYDSSKVVVANLTGKKIKTGEFSVKGFIKLFV
jgi:opacity protein-like surface antigen